MNKEAIISIATLVDDASPSLLVWLQKATLFLTQHFAHYEILLVLRKKNLAASAKLKQAISHFPKIRMIQLANDCDEDVAYSAALHTALGDAVILMDFNADPLDIVPAMAEKILQAEVEVLLGHNLTKRPFSVWHNLLSKIFYKSARFLCEQSVDFDRTHFSCYSRTAINIILQYQNNIRNLRLLRQLLGLETEVLTYAGAAYQSSPPGHIVKLLFSRIEEIFTLSVKPLRVVAAAAALLALLNFFYIGYVLLVKFFGQHIAPGWAALSLTQSVVSLVLFFSVSIVACYLNIISREIQRRPLYTIVNEWFSGETVYDLSKKNVVDS